MRVETGRERYFYIEKYLCYDCHFGIRPYSLQESNFDHNDYCLNEEEAEGQEMPPALEAVHLSFSSSGITSKSVTVTARLNMMQAVVGLPPGAPNIGGAG